MKTKRHTLEYMKKKYHLREEADDKKANCLKCEYAICPIFGRTLLFCTKISYSDNERCKNEVCDLFKKE